MKKTSAALALAALAMGASAQESPWRFMGGIGYANGGEKIASGTITTIGTNHVVPFDIQAGTGFQYRVGAEYRLSDRVALQASLGHSVSEAMGINGSIDFTVIPFELMGFVDIASGFRIGLGARQSSAEMRGTGVSANAPVNGTFVSSEGAVLELQYLFANGTAPRSKSAPQFGISLRGVNETFNHTLGTLNGNHVELGVVVYF